MKILVLNGPNLNMLGIREPDIYGKKTYADLVSMIGEHCASEGIEVECKQSNSEGTLVDYIQQAFFDKVDGIVINPGAYTHTSVALLDALKAVSIPTVEVHISKVDEREAFRQISYVSYYAMKTIIGKGFDGYIEAVDLLKELSGKKEAPASKLPKDPVMLLSFINMKLRDEYPSLGELAASLVEDENQIKQKLESVGYFYNEETNRFE